MSSNLTRLEGISKNGELILVTEDASVRHKAQSTGDESKSFVYQAAGREETVNGRVTNIMEAGTPFRFTVLPDEATLGP